MKLVAAIFQLGKQKKVVRKSVADHEQDVLLQQSREQFKKLLRFGKMPVALL